ncbi:hypothetical protein EVJ10_22405 [Salmonella enterica subsp. enterica serovar Kottbus]|nr:hypothetical protein [Salmonella enterica subsp. enterica serovar Kottbus]
MQLIHTVRTVHTLSLFFRGDPKNTSSGSASAPPARSGHRPPYLVVVIAFPARRHPICCVPSGSRYPAAARRKTALCLSRDRATLPESCE